ncbi:rubrerythrin [Clostridium massiliodielmoense]|uniref:rubrerythrin n=1 Tax=Clostridium massiliodielmoense TaxID=1776385 RepID=UPI000166A5B8|nr:rubrerythrin family protein [Clostridium massiliodielmoense]EDS78672.1 rubrerythrin [Clostridium botulinum C str. Eklund]KEH97962.1 hypothetical protein Z962_01235 [Clostridium botulinum C/D str. BKT12695]NEZ49725.1 rubrerythrin family protein [Clostridium botulinum]
MELKGSKTLENLMKAFAGESQARNRYTFAAETAKKEGYSVIEGVFNYTAAQEEAHAEQFFKLIKRAGEANVNIAGGYPVDLKDNTLDLLKDAAHNENEEAENVYVEFGKVAKEEGFEREAFVFDNIAKIEKVHHERFTRLAAELENNTLFRKDNEIAWICSKCGYIVTGKEAPQICPVCQYPQKYFLPYAESFQSNQNKA